MRSIKFLVLTLALVFSVNMLSAQEMEAKKYDNPEWYRIVYVDYKPGKTGEARKLINDYFKKAGDKAGTSGPVMEFAMNSGEYDYMYIWKLEDGIQSLDWESSPNSIKWQKAYMEMMGSEDKAKEIREKYSSLVSSAKSELARKDNL